MSKEIYGLASIFQDGYFTQHTMDKQIICDNCDEIVSRKDCKAVETPHDELVEVTFQIMDKIAVGINYYCPHCDTFLRHDVHYEDIPESEDESN